MKEPALRLPDDVNARSVVCHVTAEPSLKLAERRYRLAHLGLHRRFCDDLKSHPEAFERLAAQRRARSAALPPLQRIVRC